MKSLLNFFIIIFFLFNYAYIQSQVLPSDGLNFKSRGNQTFPIQLDDSQYTYQDYIGIILNKQKSPNPFIYVAKDEKCTERLFIGVQMIDAIYTFFKKDQINNVFYIYIRERQNSEASDYEINIISMETVIIPFDIQASYYISDDTIKNMNFTFNQKGIEENDEFTIWIKGKNITNVEMPDYSKKQIENGYIYYGTYTKEKSTILTVEANVGDYVTIGSSIIIIIIKQKN